MSESRSVFRDFGVIGAARILVMLSGLILLPILTKTWGEYDYGVWVLVITAVSLLVPVLSLGLPFAMVRFLAVKNPENEKKEIQEGYYSVFITVFGVGATISGAIYVLFGHLLQGIINIPPDIVLLVSIIVLVTCLMYIPMGFYRTFRQMGKYSIFLVAHIYGEVILISYLVLIGGDLQSALMAMLIVRFFVFITMAILVAQQIGVSMPKFSVIKEYLIFGLPTIPSGVSSWLVSYSDRFIIGFFLSAFWVGIYNPAYTIGSLIMFIPLIFGFVFPPILSKLYDQGEEEKVKQYFSTSIRWFLYLAIPFTIGSGLVSKELLLYLGTEQIANEGFFLVPLIALSSIFFGLYYIISIILFLVKKTKITGAIWIFTASLNIVLNILIIPTTIEINGFLIGGVMGAAITTIISYLITVVIVAHFSFKYIKINFDFYPLVKCIVASLIMLFVLLAIIFYLVNSLFILIPVGMLTYFAALYLSGAISPSDIKILKSAIRF